MGQLTRFVAQVLGVEGWKTAELYFETPQGTRFIPTSVVPFRSDNIIVVRLRRSWVGRCSLCGARCPQVHEHTETRRWRDLPWAGRTLMLEYAPDRLKCRRCRRTPVELLPWTDRFQRETKRLQQHMALQAQSMPTSHVAASPATTPRCACAPRPRTRTP